MNLCKYLVRHFYTETLLHFYYIIYTYFSVKKDSIWLKKQNKLSFEDAPLRKTLQAMLLFLKSKTLNVFANIPEIWWFCWLMHLTFLLLAVWLMLILWDRSVATSFQLDGFSEFRTPTGYSGCMHIKWLANSRCSCKVLPLLSSLSHFLCNSLKQFLSFLLFKSSFTRLFFSPTG